MLKLICLDAAGTLIQLAEPVGHGYARVAARFGIDLEPEATTAAFRAAWNAQPPPEYQSGPSPDGDRGWWHQLVDSVFDRTAGRKIPPAEERTFLFDALYDHYALPGSWKLFPEVTEVLGRLSTSGIRLRVVSNFDPRLRAILAGLGVARHFEEMIISSEIGSYKPDPAIFARAAGSAGVHPSACLHVGDDPAADVAGAQSAGFHTLHIDRPRITLRCIFDHPHFPT